MEQKFCGFCVRDNTPIELIAPIGTISTIDTSSPEGYARLFALSAITPPPPSTR